LKVSYHLGEVTHCNCWSGKPRSQRIYFVLKRIFVPSRWFSILMGGCVLVGHYSRELVIVIAPITSQLIIRVLPIFERAIRHQSLPYHVSYFHRNWRYHYIWKCLHDSPVLMPFQFGRQLEFLFWPLEHTCQHTPGFLCFITLPSAGSHYPSVFIWINSHVKPIVLTNTRVKYGHFYVNKK